MWFPAQLVGVVSRYICMPNGCFGGAQNTVFFRALVIPITKNMLPTETNNAAGEFSPGLKARVHCEAVDVSWCKTG